MLSGSFLKKDCDGAEHKCAVNDKLSRQLENLALVERKTRDIEGPHKGKGNIDISQKLIRDVVAAVAINI